MCTMYFSFLRSSAGSTLLCCYRRILGRSVSAPTVAVIGASASETPNIKHSVSLRP